MSEIVLRVRLVSGDQLDVSFEDDGDEDEVIDRVVETLAEDSGNVLFQYTAAVGVDEQHLDPRPRAVRGRSAAPQVLGWRRWRSWRGRRQPTTPEQKANPSDPPVPHAHIRRHGVAGL